MSSSPSPAGRRSGGRRPRAPQGEGTKLRDELIDAAARILAREGRAEAVTLRAVAREVGIAAPSIYLHFEDRDQLLRAVLVRTFADFAAYLEQAYEHAGADPVDRLRAGCRAYCEFATESPNAYAVLFAGLIAPSVSAEGEGMAAFELLVGGVATVMTAGRMPATEPFVVARRIWTHLHGAMALRRALPEFVWQSLDELVDEILIHTGGVTGLRETG